MMPTMPGWQGMGRLAEGAARRRRARRAGQPIQPPPRGGGARTQTPRACDPGRNSCLYSKAGLRGRTVQGENAVGLWNCRILQGEYQDTPRIHAPTVRLKGRGISECLPAGLAFPALHSGFGGGSSPQRRFRCRRCASPAPCAARSVPGTVRPASAWPETQKAPEGVLRGFGVGGWCGYLTGPRKPSSGMSVGAPTSSIGTSPGRFSILEGSP